MDRPTIAQRLRRDGPPAVPRPSASVIVVRAAGAGVELLLVRRNPQQRFMGGFWVFPGGAVDEGESHRAAAVRELAEEAQIGVDPGDLAEYSRWITPEAIEVRFDTHFFLARLPAGARARVDGQECVDLRWVTPRDALEACSRGDLALVFPTIKLLEGLGAFASVEELFAHARDVVVAPVLPRVVAGADAPRVLLPGEPGYDDEEAV